MKKRILIVDDSLYMRSVLRNILTDAGYEIIGESSNGEDTLEIISDKKPDLVTLDFILPKRTGQEILEEIKNHDPLIKVVMITAVGQEAIVHETLKKGASAYIVKPFQEDKVLEIIENVLN